MIPDDYVIPERPVSCPACQTESDIAQILSCTGTIEFDTVWRNSRPSRSANVIPALHDTVH